MNKCAVISGYYGFGNFGDEIILSVLTKKLKDCGIEPIVLSSNPEKTSKEHFVNSINSFNFYQVSGLIKQSDILISGGGSLLQDVTSIKSLLYYLWIIFTAIRYKKKVIIFAQGIGPIKNKIAQIITAKLLKKCDYVSVRDLKSHQLLEKWDVKSELLCDPVFSIKVNHSENLGKLGIQLRSFPSINDDFLKKLANQVVENFGNMQVEIFSLQNSLDIEICKRFEQILKSIEPNMITEVISNVSNDKIIERLSNLEYLIAMRFHAIVIALKASVKTLAINYDIKVEKLALSSDIPAISLNEDDFGHAFNSLKNSDKNKIEKFVDSQNFDWTNFQNIILH